MSRGFVDHGEGQEPFDDDYPESNREFAPAFMMGDGTVVVLEEAVTPDEEELAHYFLPSQPWDIVVEREVGAWKILKSIPSK